MIDIFYYQNGLKKGKLKDLSKLKSKKIWIDITNITKEEAALVHKAFKLHHLTVEDFLHPNDTRIKVEEFPHYLFLVFYGIRNDARKSKQFQMVELDFVLGERFLITNHETRLESYENLKSDKAKLGGLLDKGAEFVFHMLLDREIDNYIPVLENIDSQIESIEEELTEKPHPQLLARILKLKRQIVSVKKITFPQREKISFIAKNEYSLLSKDVVPYLRDIYDRSIRVSDSIDNYREAIGNTFDAYMSTVSNKMGEVMKLLSVIATIALPLTVVSSIYGTNFDFLPGQHYAYSFWIMISVMLIVVVGMALMFRRRGWF